MSEWGKKQRFCYILRQKISNFAVAIALLEENHRDWNTHNKKALFCLNFEMIESEPESHRCKINIDIQRVST